MKLKAVRIVPGILTAFVALTSIGGGVALLTGAEGNRFPLAWLDGTPFRSYMIPALILTLVVGGSALLASVITFQGRKSGARFLMVSGLLLAGFVTIEALILKQVPPGPTGIEAVYFAIGATILGFAVYLWGAQRQSA